MGRGLGFERSRDGGINSSNLSVQLSWMLVVAFSSWSKEIVT